MNFESICQHWLELNSLWLWCIIEILLLREVTVRIALSTRNFSIFKLPLHRWILSIRVLNMIMLNYIAKVFVHWKRCWLVFIHSLNRLSYVFKISVLVIFEISWVWLCLRFKNLRLWLSYKNLIFLIFHCAVRAFFSLQIISSPSELAPCFLLVSLLQLLRLDTKPLYFKVKHLNI